MSQETKKVANIVCRVSLDSQNVPEKIEWSATDFVSKEYQVSKALLLSIWDPKDQKSLGIDLWTKDMAVGEMYEFFYQNLIRLSQTLENATNNNNIARLLKDFAETFAKEIEKESKLKK